MYWTKFSAAFLPIVLGVSTELTARSKTRPNILFISTDQQRTSTLGSYGSTFAHSPNLDQLAQDGVRFTEAYTASPVCSPSRTSMLLGVHVPIHGIVENDMTGTYREGPTPYFDQLKKAGYHTSLIGKTHFHPVPKSIDHLDVHTGNSDKRGANISEYDFLETYLVNQTMQWIEDVTPGGGGQHDTGAPWFAYLSMVSPHPPNWVPPGPWRHVYDGVKLPPLNYREGNIAAIPYQTRMLLGLLGKEESNPPAFPNGTANMKFIDQAVTQGGIQGRYNYYAQAAYVDAQVGRMLRFLDRKGLTNDTLVIFASDHGTELFDHGINNDKHNFLDASLRVPLIMRMPGVLPANSTRAFANTLDIPATILAAAGAEVPLDYQGFDLLTPISEGLPSPRKVGISTEYRAHAVVTPTWKLAYFYEQGEGRLWDRVNDPEEQNDLYNSEHTKEIRDGLLLALLRWRAQQDQLGFLQSQSKAAGPAAKCSHNHTMNLHSLDAEIQLQEDAMKFERTSLAPGQSRKTFV